MHYLLHFEEKFICPEDIKQILFNSNEFFVLIKKSLSNKLFFSIQSNLFSQCNTTLVAQKRRIFPKSRKNHV